MKFYFNMPTPFGEMGLIFNKNPFILIKTLLPVKNQKELQLLFDREEAQTYGSSKEVEIIASSIRQYFTGKPITLNWEWMKLDLLTDLQRSVLEATADIEFGTVKSYKQVAQAIESPKASRFVGNTLAKNPFPLLIPCHRVVRSDGSYGQFGGGIKMKEGLIKFEAENRND